MKDKKPAVKHTTVKKAPVKKPVLKKTEVKRPQSLVSLHNLKAPFGAHKKKKLLGRGPGSGHGKTSTRGSKGQTSRAGRHFYLGFEGGQSPLIRKMPKRGFVSNFKKSYQIVNLDELNRIKETTITPQLLREKGLIRDEGALIKILGDGTIKNPVTVQAHAFSKRAASQISDAGGKAEIINV
ncbi:MAG: 50S ribosomal protein L15 [Candidatus Omnitrophica bacterium]|nr:50S ribosomal protein L15 [Candidatus Omnitrophota bacterium]